MKKWESVRLGDFIKSLESGKRPKGGVDSYTQGAISLGGKHINRKNGHVNLQSLKYVPLEFYETYARKDKAIVKENDILLCKDGELSGKVALVRKEFINQKAMINEHIFLIRCKSEKEQKYLFYFLYSSEGQKILQSKITGSAQGGINKENLKSLQIPLPPLEIQENIAHILSVLDSKIELNNRINKALEKLSKLLYTRYFVEFNFPNAEGKPYKQSGGEMIYNPTLKQEIPKGWEVSNIKDLCNIKSGFAFSSKDYDKNGQYKLITITNVQDGYINIETDNKILKIPSKMPVFCKLNKGDMLISLTGNVGRVGLVWSNNLLLNQRVGLIEEKLYIYKAFLYCFFRSNATKQMSKNLSGGTSQDNLSPILMEEILITKPPTEVLHSFNIVNKGILELMIQKWQESQKLSALRDYLLPLLFNNQVEVC